MKRTKHFLIDTNIPLDSYDNTEILSQEGENPIIIVGTVSEELDAKKSGLESINYNARQFNHIMSESDVVSSGKLTDNLFRVIVTHEGVVYHLIEQKSFQCTKMNMDRSILNDSKIIETAEEISKVDEYNNLVVIISNDVAFRTRALMKGLDVEPFKQHDFIEPVQFTLKKDVTIDIENMTTIDELESIIGEKITEETSSFVFINTTTGKPSYFIKENNKIVNIDTVQDEYSNVKRYITPRNLEQKFYSSLILSNMVDVVISSAVAGSGKTIVSFSDACTLMKAHRDVYQKIIYMRKTVVSEERNAELGFLPGSIDDKLRPFTMPIEDCIEFFVNQDLKGKNKKFEALPADELALKVVEFKNKYNIQYDFAGHLRGRTLSNAIILLDETQNFSVSDLRTIISRIGENVKLVVMGSTKQIDNVYLNKFNNGLTFLENECKKQIEGVQVQGIKLTKVVRSPMSKWGDNF